MDRITEEDNSLQTERKLASPPSLKRLRTHCTLTDKHSGESRFEFSELLTFWNSSLKNTLQKNVFLVHTAANKNIQDEKPYEETQDTKLIVTPITEVTTGSSKVCFIAAERHFVRLSKDEQPPVNESDKLCSYPLDNAGGALAESHTSKDSTTDMSSHPDCIQLLKSHEDEFNGGCCLPTGNDIDGRQVQHSVSQIQAFTLSSSDEKVTYQSDCTNENVLYDAGLCNSQIAEVEVSNQKQDKHGFSKEEEEGNSLKSSSDYAGFKLYYSYAEEDPSRNFAEDVTNEEKILELQICENENVAICDGETKGQVNENSMSKNSILPIAECAEGSVVSYDVVLAKSNATENASFEIDDLSGAKGEHAAGKMIVKGRNEMADHTTETPISARISQEPAEGDNNPGLFSVIEPAIWSETDSEAIEERCNSESTLGVELSPSIKACKMETPLSLCFDVKPSQVFSASNQTRQFNCQSTTQQCKSEKEDLCQSYTEPQAFSITTSETHKMTGNQGDIPCSSAKPPRAGDVKHESHKTVGHQLKKQDQSHCCPVSLDNLMKQEREQSQAEIARMDGTTKVKEREEKTSFEKEIQTDEHRELEKGPKSEKECLQQNELHEDTTEISSGVCNSDWTEGESTEIHNRLPLVEDVNVNNFDCFFDHSYSANMSRMLDTAVDKERKVTNVSEEMKTDRHENSEIVVKSEDDLLQQIEYKKEITAASHVECIGDWTEDNMSTSANKLILLIQHEAGSKLSSCPDDQDRAETCMVENTDDLVAFTSPLTSDAVVPCLNDLSYSQNTNNKPTAPNCSGRFPPMPSAFSLYNRAAGGFDTFKKIQLSPDDDDNYDAFLTSLPGQLLNTPQQQPSHSMPGAQSKGHDQPSEEEEEEEEEKGEKKVERLECHTVYIADGFLNRDTNCNGLPDFIPAADVIAINWPEQQYNCEPILNSQSKSSTGSTESDSQASDVSSYPDFEMKKQFDMVLKELNLFFDISVSDFASHRASSPEQCHDITEPLEADSRKEHLSSTDLQCHRNTSTDEDCSLEVCGGDPVVSFIAGSGDGEQEVPLGSHSWPETSMYTAEKHRGPLELEQRGKTWSPSFMCLPLLEQLSYRPEQPKRLEPLRTCTRPIRVGLSKRAKTKHLHRPHPYK